MVRSRPNVSVVQDYVGDIGEVSHFVAVPADRDEPCVREFLPFTEDLNEIARWLTACDV